MVIIAGGNDRTFSDAIDMVRYGIERLHLKLFKVGDGSMEVPKFLSKSVCQGKVYIWSLKRR